MSSRRSRPSKQSSSKVPKYLDGFHPPNFDERRAALGSFSENGQEIGGDGKVLMTNPENFLLDDLFHPIPPAPNSDLDWLCNYEERQSYSEFLVDVCDRRKGLFKRSVNTSSTIYLLPIGDFQSACEPNILSIVSQYVSSFYACRVKVLQRIIISDDSNPASKFVLWNDASLHKPAQMVVNCQSNSQSKSNKSAPSASSVSLKKLDEAKDCAGDVIVIADDEDVDGQDCESPAMIKARFHRPSGRRQLHIDPILNELAATIQSDAFCEHHPDAVCIMGITMEDLYSDDTDLFVAGMAAGGSHVAVFSLHRYMPGFTYSEEHWFEHSIQSSSASTASSSAQSKRPSVKKKSKLSAAPASSSSALASNSFSSADIDLFVRRACRLMSHELGHLFGVGHCIYYQCCMNGSGHLAEDDSQPLHICPVDLRKLHFRVRLDVCTHYRLLIRFFESTELTQRAFANELQFAMKCLARLQ